MKQLYKIAFISLMAGFITAAVANDSDTPSVVERKTCSDIAAEITELSAIEEPDDETIELLESLKQQQRSRCQKAAKGRIRTPANKMQSAHRTPGKARTTEETSDETSDETPDENGCMPGETLTDLGDQGFACCPETGDMCFLPIKPETDDKTEEIKTLEIEEQPETEPQPELTDEQRAENVANGLCADGTKPNKFGCCGDEIFTDLGNLEFACCPKSGGDCFPPIK